MIQQINHLVDKIMHLFSQNDEIDSLQRIPYKTEFQESMYCLKIDVFSKGNLPTIEQRIQLFNSAAFFETNSSGNKDRLFMEKIPVHINYKSLDDVQVFIDGITTPPYVLHQDSTYGLFRLAQGIPILSRSNWLNVQKKRIETLNDDFWNFHFKEVLLRLEHELSDLGISIFNKDPLLYQLSMAKFLELVCEALFTVNHIFTPSPEEVNSHVTKLEILPSGFSGIYENLLKENLLDNEKRLKLARLLLENIMALK